MFSPGFHEILVILLVLIIVFKPEDIPAIVKKVIRAYNGVRKYLNDIISIFDDDKTE